MCTCIASYGRPSFRQPFWRPMAVVKRPDCKSRCFLLWFCFSSQRTCELCDTVILFVMTFCTIELPQKYPAFPFHFSEEKTCPLWIHRSSICCTMFSRQNNVDLHVQSAREFVRVRIEKKTHSSSAIGSHPSCFNTEVICKNHRFGLSFRPYSGSTTSSSC